MIVNENSFDWLKNREDNSIDHIITDPPYLIDFMGKGWDSEDNIAGSVEFWKETLRVCKSGSYALVFGHSRTHHRVMVAMENAGWEIRDCLMWVQGQGFPKSHELGAKIDKALGHIGHRGKRVKHQVGQEHLEKPEAVGRHEPISEEAKEWSGWGENLKPAWEAIIMARKPFKGSLTNNVLTNKLGALNIDACRVGNETNPQKVITTKGAKFKSWSDDPEKTRWHNQGFNKLGGNTYETKETTGRFPANIILDEEAGKLLDEQAPKTGNAFKSKRKKDTSGGSGNSWTNGGKEEGEDNGIYDGLSGASKFFYCPKVSSKERNFGCENLPQRQTIGGGGTETDIAGAYGSVKAKSGNHHPTLKPIELMKWLVKLVSIEGQVILDPFTGSGSTGIAVELLGREFIGVELDPDYCEIAKARINAWKEKENNTLDEQSE